MEKCKKCLLLEAGERVTYEEIMNYLNSLNKSELADEVTYKERITNCINCDNLISGMCLKCGCYVEVRARLMDSYCPDADNERW